MVEANGWEDGKNRNVLEGYGWASWGAACCAPTRNCEGGGGMTSVGEWAKLNLNPAIWGAIAATGWS
jgi:hypothetical protein